MFRKARTSFLSSIVIAVLVLSAVAPTIAYADDGGSGDKPSTPKSTECTSDSSSKDCPAQEATQTPVPTESTDAVTTGDATEAAATPVPATEAAATEVPAEPSADAATPAPTEEAAPAADTSTQDAAPAADTTVLDAVPENTTVTVLDANGESQPLATQDAAAAIAESDPIWCPEGQAPTPGANGCTASYSSFTDLLTFLSGNAAYQGAGTIYVQQGAYHGGESSIDLNSSSYDLSNIHNSNLTITGGWNTSSNTVDPAATSSFTVPILIGTGTNPWGGTLTINNLSIDGANGNGLTLYSVSDINLTNVTVKNSPNGSGAELDAGGNVTIKSSNFERNKVSAATIRAKGSVAISDSNFSNRVDGRRRLQLKGLDITSSGSVSLFNVMAINNREVGALINAAGRVTIVQSVFSGTKTINNGEFLGYGLQVTTPDAIDLDTVTANDNFLWGASLNAGGDVTIANSQFNANTTESPGYIDDTGLLVTSGGNVSIQNTLANDNRLIGAKIDAQGDVSINSSSFSNNNGVTNAADGTPLYHGYGLQVTTPGNIFINMVTASNNTLYGAHLESGADTIISNSDFSNQTSSTTTEMIGRGLEVISGGNIFLDTVTINNNQTFGANLKAAGDIFLGTVTATGNGTDGISLQAMCTHLFGGNISSNGGVGLNLGTSALDLMSPPTFGGNGQGDMVPAAPVSCAPGATPTVPETPTTPATPATPGTTVTQAASGSGFSFLVSAASSNSNSASAVSGGTSYAGMSLNTYLASIRTGNASSHGLFIGKYAYVESLAGLQVFAILPEAQVLAMGS